MPGFQSGTGLNGVPRMRMSWAKELQNKSESNVTTTTPWQMLSFITPSLGVLLENSSAWRILPCDMKGDISIGR